MLFIRYLCRGVVNRARRQAMFRRRRTHFPGSQNLSTAATSAEDLRNY